MTLMADLSGQQIMPLRMTQMTAQQARLITALAQVTEPLALTGQGGQMMLRLEPARPEAAEHPWLGFTLDGVSGWLQLSWGAARRVAGTPVESALPEDAALLVEEGLAGWLDEAEAATGAALRFESLSTEEPPETANIAATLALQGVDGHRNRVHMRLGLRLTSEGAEALARVQNARRAPHVSATGVMLRLVWEADVVRLPLARVRALEPGDAIAEAVGGAQARLVLQNRLSAPVIHEQGQGVRLTGPFTPIRFEQTEGAAAMSETQHETDTPALTEAQLDEIEVRVSFRAGETLMDLATLRGLAPGAVVQLDDDPGGRVDILVNGQRIGAGEIIDVAGRRAVQIKTLFTAN